VTALGLVLLLILQIWLPLFGISVPTEVRVRVAGMLLLYV
jgi:hypothetical protein